jgi:Xaa-Pro aminopeptidase
MTKEHISNKLFIKNRAKLINKLKPNSISIIFSNDEMPRNGDQKFPYRQNSDLFYLTGINQEQSILILYPDCKTQDYKEILFILKSNELIEKWNGHKLTFEEAKELSGINNILLEDSFVTILDEIMPEVNTVYLSFIENPTSIQEVISRNERYGKLARDRYYNHQFKNLSPILNKFRTYKEFEEISQIKHAASITEKAFYRVLKFVKPSVKEYEIEAEITHEFTINRADGHAYDPIIASGDNANCLHYIENSDECKYGELILFDFGAEYNNYASDLSRTIPVNGKFTERQKACYNAVLRVMKSAIKLMVVGSSIEKIHKEACKMMEKEMIDLGLFTKEDAKNHTGEKPLFFKYFPHGISHFIGLDVHDTGTKQDIFKEGMVLSCEPGLYIEEEKLGIRLEDDILITNEGPINLTKEAPIEIEDIEKLMNI